VAEHLLDDLHVRAGGERQCRCAVSKIMEPYRWQLSGGNQVGEVTGDEVWMHELAVGSRRSWATT
jgi:hypothetical protein